MRVEPLNEGEVYYLEVQGRKTRVLTRKDGKDYGYIEGKGNRELTKDELRRMFTYIGGQVDAGINLVKEEIK